MLIKPSVNQVRRDIPWGLSPEAYQCKREIGKQTSNVISPERLRQAPRPPRRNLECDALGDIRAF
jgi:hypothetical protein